MPDEKRVLKIISIICLLLIVVSFLFPDIPGPSSWLIDWTSWFVSVIGVVMAVKVFWTASDLIKQYMAGKAKKMR